MINVNPTAEHLQQINQHKKFLEKWDMWQFAFLLEGNYYFLVQYKQITGKISGYLILDGNGQKVSRDQAVKAGYYLIRYNTLLQNTIDHIGPRMHKSVKPFKDTLMLLEKNKGILIEENPQLADSIYRIMAFLKENIESPAYMKEIYYTIGGYQREVTGKLGYFDREFLNKMDDETLKYSETMYRYGITQRKLKEEYHQLGKAAEQSLRLSALDKRNLIGLLKAAVDSAEEELEKSLATFEKDTNGKPLYIDPENIGKSIQTNEINQGKQDYEKSMVPKFRN